MAEKKKPVKEFKLTEGKVPQRRKVRK